MSDLSGSAPPVFPRGRLRELAERIGPRLRERQLLGAEDGDSDGVLVILAGGTEMLDALWAAGMLTFDDVDDRAHLRASWAALTRALEVLSQHRPLTAEVLEQVPASHRPYLQGHQARREHLAGASRKLEQARTLAWALQDQVPAEARPLLRPLLAALGADLPPPYSEVGVHSNNGTKSTRWLQKSTDPLLVAAGMARPADDRTRQASDLLWTSRRIVAVAAPGEHDGYGPKLVSTGWPESGPLWPVGSRIMAAPWPEGTRAVARDVRVSAELVESATFWVVVPDAPGVFVGRLVRLDRDAGDRRWWRCGKCGLGADGCPDDRVADAERFGHELICPGDLESVPRLLEPAAARDGQGPAGG